MTIFDLRTLTSILTRATAAAPFLEEESMWTTSPIQLPQKLLFFSLCCKSLLTGDIQISFEDKKCLLETPLPPSSVHNLMSFSTLEHFKTLLLSSCGCWTLNWFWTTSTLQIAHKMLSQKTFGYEKKHWDDHSNRMHQVSCENMVYRACNFARIVNGRDTLQELLAPTGALVLMMVYYILSAHFFRFSLSPLMQLMLL